jgi:glycosyltransferase involved in cell wall biosynthesis
MIRYSICITNYNSKNTLRRCLESVLCQIDSNFEIVVSDNCSNDGSLEILEEYAKTGKIKLIVAPSSRGQGRQIAFENSVGTYIISDIDTDDFIKPVLKDILRLYHEKHEGFMLAFGTLHIIPRKLVVEVGGWRNLQYYEDVDFAKRVELIGKIHYFEDSQAIIVRGSEKGHFFNRLKKAYSIYQCGYIIGKDIFHNIGRDPSHPLYMRPLLLLDALFAVALAKVKHLEKLKY